MLTRLRTHALTDLVRTLNNANALAIVEEQFLTSLAVVSSPFVLHGSVCLNDHCLLTLLALALRKARTVRMLLDLQSGLQVSMIVNYARWNYGAPGLPPHANVSQVGVGQVLARIQVPAQSLALAQPRICACIDSKATASPLPARNAVAVSWLNVARCCSCAGITCCRSTSTSRR